jgi:hypothetical protein
MLLDFLQELSSTFPDVQELSHAVATLDAALILVNTTGLHADAPMKHFMAIFEPHADLITKKDSNLFELCKIDVGNEEYVDLQKIWNIMDDDNKEATWAYMQQLAFLGNASSYMTPEMNDIVSKITRETMEAVQRGDITEEQAQDPTYIMTQLMMTSS